MPAKETPLVVAGCPVSRRFIHTIDFNGENNDAFYGWLNNMSHQEYNTDKLKIALYMNDVTDEMYQHAREVAFVQRVSTERNLDVKRSDRWQDSQAAGEKPYQRYANVRNSLIDYIISIQTEAKYFFSVDSDVMIQHDAVSRCVNIMESNPEIAMLGIPVNNSRKRSIKHPLGLFMGSAHYSYGYAGIYLPNDIASSGYNKGRSFPENKIFPVDYVGACVMIRMDILNPPLSIRYGPHRQGEDIYFCHNVKQAGLKMYIDTSQVTMHIMDPKLLEHDIKYFTSNKHI